MKETQWDKYKSNPDEWCKGGKEPPAEFTNDDSEEFKQLLSQGFTNWNKRDFFNFIKMCELYGRENLDLFSELHYKTKEEI